MGDQTSAYSEKKIAFYDAQFRAGMLSKPLDISITITAGHVYGIGYVMEQKGTMQTEPEYSHFNCSYDEITRVYCTAAQTTPIYIQCDEEVRGIVNSCKIIIPCLEDPDSIVAQILYAKDQYDEKKRKSEERKRAQKENEVAVTAVKKPVAVEKNNDVTDKLRDLKNNVDTEYKSVMKPSEKKSSLFDDIKSTLPSMNSKKDSIVSKLNTEIKLPKIDKLPKIEIEVPGFGSKVSKPHVNEVNSVEVKPVNVAVDAKPVNVVEEVVPKAVEDVKPVIEKVEQNKIETEVKAAEDAFIVAEETVVDEIAIAEAENSVEEPTENEPEPKAVHVDFSSSVDKDMSLDEFQLAVKKLKSMLDNGLISKEEFAAEKKNLLSKLY